MSDEELRRAELRQFLQGRRARIRPEDVGLQSRGRRRVPGLRREEVAAIAGVGLTWYTMFETGTAQGVSADVIDSVARALQLTSGETAHLQGLASRISWHTEIVTLDPIVREALHRWVQAPAYIIGRAWDVLDWNEAYSRVWGIERPGNPSFNIILRYFVDEQIRAPLGDSWPAFARRLVAMFRLSWGRHLADDRYTALLEALRTEPEFATLWESQIVEHPMSEMSVTIGLPSGESLTYDVLNLTYTDDHQQALVVQVPRSS